MIKIYFSPKMVFEKYYTLYATYWDTVTKREAPVVYGAKHGTPSVADYITSSNIFDFLFQQHGFYGSANCHTPGTTAVSIRDSRFVLFHLFQPGNGVEILNEFAPESAEFRYIILRSPFEKKDSGKVR